MSILEEAQRQNFNVYDDKGCLMLKVPMDDYHNPIKERKIEKDFRSFLRSMDYKGSYGFHAENNNTG